MRLLDSFTVEESVKLHAGTRSTVYNASAKLA
jgi:hypothetical protein